MASPVFTGAAVLTALLRPTAALFLSFFVFFETLRAFFKADHRIVPVRALRPCRRPVSPVVGMVAPTPVSGCYALHRAR